MQNPPSEPILLIDADGLIWIPATVFESEEDWGNTLTISFDFEAAKAYVDAIVTKLVTRFQPANVIMCLSGFGNWRKDLLPSYKGNRKGKRAPIGINKMRDWLKAEYTVVEKPLLEADDQIGILATKPDNLGKCIVVSEDKDMLQIPGWHLRDDKLVHVTQEEADRFHLYQTLVGDTADNYGGAWRIGPVKAAAILDYSDVDAFSGNDPMPSKWPAIVEAFKGDEAEALKMARVARILRWTDWDVERQEVKLWHPTER